MLQIHQELPKNPHSFTSSLNRALVQSFHKEATFAKSKALVRSLCLYSHRIWLKGLKKHLGLESSSSQSAPGMFSYLRRGAAASGSACYDNVFGITGRWKSQNKFFKMEQGYLGPQTETIKPGAFWSVKALNLLYSPKIEGFINILLEYYFAGGNVWGNYRNWKVGKLEAR